MKAYHTIQHNFRSFMGHEKPWTVGESRSVEGKVVLCENGYHYSPSPYEAITCAWFASTRFDINYAQICIVDVDENDRDMTVSRIYDKEYPRIRKGVSRTRKLLFAMPAAIYAKQLALDIMKFGAKNSPDALERSGFEELHDYCLSDMEEPPPYQSRLNITGYAFRNGDYLKVLEDLWYFSDIPRYHNYFIRHSKSLLERYAREDPTYNPPQVGASTSS